MNNEKPLNFDYWTEITREEENMWAEKKWDKDSIGGLCHISGGRDAVGFYNTSINVNNIVTIYLNYNKNGGSSGKIKTGNKMSFL